MHEKIPNSNDQNNKQKNAVDYQRAMDKFWNLVLVICYLFVFWCLRFVILECGIKRRRNVLGCVPTEDRRNEAQRGTKEYARDIHPGRSNLSIFIDSITLRLNDPMTSSILSCTILVHRISERLGQYFDNPGNIGDEHEGHDHHRVERQQ
jgi:hypothetical protein